MSLNGKYEVYVTSSLEKEKLKRLPKKYHKVLDQKIAYLKENPNHPSLNTKLFNCSKETKKRLKKQGVDKVYEFYINKKEYRCILYVSDTKKEIYLVHLGTHDQIAKKFSR